MDKHEPVAWANAADLQNFDMRVRTNCDHYHTVPLYTAPPKRDSSSWVGLTDVNEMVEAELTHYCNGEYDYLTGARDHLTDFAQAIEAKLKEKNGG